MQVFVWSSSLPFRPLPLPGAIAGVSHEMERRPEQRDARNQDLRF